MYSINVDIGGTFTDGFFRREDESRQVKVFTTPHDYTECFLECLQEGAYLFSTSIENMLLDTASIKLSSTIGTNMLVQQKGSRLGLIVSKGYEDTLYAEDSEKVLPVKKQVIYKEMIFGVNRRGVKSEVVRSEDISELIEAVKSLVERRATMIAISLKDAHLNPDVEVELRDSIREFYPEHYLRYIPIQISTEVTDVPEDFERTCTVCFNCYLHKELGSSLYKIEDKVRNYGYKKPLLIVNTYGGTTRIAKTRAVDTYGSGPVSGLIGASKWQKAYGFPKVIAVDMGGTSLDVGVILNGEVPYNFNPVVEGIPVSIPMIDVRSLGAGGGSIARVDDTGEVQVGPESAGSIPGPACYGRGGESPTTTDADVIVGCIDPNYFLGGKFKLNRDDAIDAMTRITKEPGVGVEEMASRVVQKLHSSNATLIQKFIKELGHSSDELVMMSYGGAGGVHCGGLAKALGIAKIIVFPTSSVFGAFGVGVLDVSHILYRNLPIQLYEVSSASYVSDTSLIKNTIKDLFAQGRKEMKSEGFGEEQVEFVSSFILSDLDGKYKKMIMYPKAFPDNQSDIKALCDMFRTELSKSQEPLNKGDIALVSCVLTARYRLARETLGQQQDFAGEDASSALKGRRSVYWEKGVWETTPVFEWSALRTGNVVKGPGIVEAPDTTYVLYPGMELKIDNYGNGIIDLNANNVSSY